MTCESFKIGDAVGIICSRGKRRPNCAVPGCGRPAMFECDWPVKRKKSGTCDARLCEAHRVKVGEDRDLCPPHFKLHEQQPRSLEQELAELELRDPAVRAAGEQLDLVAKELGRRSGGDER